MNFSILVHAVLEYLKDHHPAAPEESNFQAELKAASHWYWFKDNERTQFVSHHFDDIQLKKVAKVALKRWTQKLNELELQAEKLPSATQGDLVMTVIYLAALRNKSQVTTNCFVLLNY